jgi:thiamine-phosphate pyrophosphorylase
VNAALPRLHAVTDDRVAAMPDLVRRATAMASVAGPDLAVHLRTRRLEGRAFLELARALGAALRPYGAWLVLNDRADIARAVSAQGVVTGRGGLLPEDARRVAPQATIGRSVHDAAECRAAAKAGADFLVAGAVYTTASHPDTAPAGLAIVRDAAGTGRPVIAIGGMTADRASEVLAAGAHGVAAIRALWDTVDAAAAAAAFVDVLPTQDLVDVEINGEPRHARRGITIAELLGDLSLDPRAVVVEHNRRIVRRDALATVRVADGDRFELVHFVGGG